MNFAKLCKSLRFILALVFLFYGFILACNILEYQNPEIASEQRPSDEIFADIIKHGAIVAVVFLLDIVCFVGYARNKRKLKQEQERENEDNRVIDPGKRRKTRTLLCAIGGLAAGFGLIYSMAIPAFGIVAAAGVVLLLAGLSIKIRTAENQNKTIREQEGNLLHITYPAKKGVDKYYFYPTECAKIIQDAINDGYTELDSFTQLESGRVKLTFSTNLSRAELQKQHDRRDTYFITNGRNASSMPEYFSAEPKVIGHYHYEEGRIWEEKEEVYKYDEYDIYKDGSKVGTETKNKRFSHYELVKYQEQIETWSFYNLDETPYYSKDGRQLAVSTVSNKELSRCKL